MAGEEAGMLPTVSLRSPKPSVATHLVVPETTEQAGHVVSDPARQWARRPIPAGCMAGLRSWVSGRARRHRENSQTGPIAACCWGCGRGRHRATPSGGDSARREAARWDLARNSSNSSSLASQGVPDVRRPGPPTWARDSAGCDGLRDSPAWFKSHQGLAGPIPPATIHGQVVSGAAGSSPVRSQPSPTRKIAGPRRMMAPEPNAALLERCRPPFWARLQRRCRLQRAGAEQAGGRVARVKRGPAPEDWLLQVVQPISTPVQDVLVGRRVAEGI